MSHDFDQPVNRLGTHAVKFDDRVRKFGSDDVMPLWIADMDFAVPPCVTEALIERAQHPIYGYTAYPESLFQAFAGWCARRHRWAVAREWLLPASGVLAALCAAVKACTATGDAVIVQSPVYGGFFQAAQTDGRRLLFNPLRETGGRYTMDLAGLEQCARQGARALLLCNPHNPVGRAWTRDELDAVLAIARRFDLAIVSDEVHGDLALPGATHLPLGALARADDRVVTLVSPGKTFNLQGLAQAMLVVPRRDLHDAVAQQLEAAQLTSAEPFAIAAAEAAWRDGDAWLDALLAYLAGTRDLVARTLRASLPKLHTVPPEAGYLLWLDCRVLGMGDDALRDFFVHRCKLGLNPGIDFGPDGSGFMRMNIGTPRRNVEAALETIEAALG